MASNSSFITYFGTTINKDSKRTLPGELYNSWKDFGDELCIRISWGNGSNLDPFEERQTLIVELQSQAR